MAEIEAKNLIYTYSRGTPFEHRALDNISFKVGAGEFVGVIGHTGSGKSTLMQHLNGLLKPDSGTILLNGEDVHAKGYDLKKLRSTVGLVFQYPEYQLFEETVEKDIAFGPKNMGLSAEEIDERVHYAAKILELDEKQLKRSPFELSGGQRRRAAIAGVLAMSPEILVLDEPTAGLDPYSRNKLMDEIRRYREETGATIMLVTHSMEDIANIAGRIIVLAESKILMDDIPENVFFRAEELVEIGLDVPQITKVFLELKKQGINLNTAVYTVDYAIKRLERLFGGLSE